MKNQVVEFLGTFFFVLTIVMTANPFAIATMLMAWVYIGAYVSGGNYNPMISLALALRGRLRWDELPWYMVAQILGGFAAFLFVGFLQHRVTIPSPGMGVSLLQAFLVEVLLSFVLALVVLTVATAEKFRTSHIFGFAIGFTIPALAALGGPISGGLFNPAIALGATLYSLVHGLPVVWVHLLMYLGGAFLGAFLAACAFKYFMDERV